jgi:hypothetical protein
MNASEWLSRVKAGASQYFPDGSIFAQVLRETRVKVHIQIGEGIFADLFFREETGRVDYALIVGEKRRYGLDNLGGWHEHPLNAPESHVPIEAPPPEEALRRLQMAADALKR